MLHSLIEKLPSPVERNAFNSVLGKVEVKNVAQSPFSLKPLTKCGQNQTSMKTVPSLKPYENGDSA